MLRTCFKFGKTDQILFGMQPNLAIGFDDCFAHKSQIIFQIAEITGA